MNLEDIKDFLRNSPGYQKEGKNRLALLLEDRGYDVTVEDCALALREVRLENKEDLPNDIAPKGTLHSRWQAANGEWRESYRYKEDEDVVSETEVFDKLKKHYSQYKAVDFKHIEFEGLTETCGFINLFDAHIDKISLASETDSNSSIIDNVNRFNLAFDQLLTSIAIAKPEKIIIPVGNDFFNRNSAANTTKKGTPMDYNTRFEDAFEIGLKLIRTCIDKARQVAPVEIVTIKGNHDEDAVFHLGLHLDLIYEDTESVNILRTRHQRKYLKYGLNMFGLAHGDKEKQKIDQLPLIMATEAPQLWADTKYRIFFLGDLHHKIEYKFLRVKDYPGVEVKFLRSVGTSDRWHTDHGYIGVPATAEAYLFSKTKGQIANYSINI